MYLYGSFLTQQNETVTVHIVTGGDRSRSVEIGAKGSGVDFPAGDPVTIDSEVNDTFDCLLRSSATVRLLTRDFLPELFCPSCMDAVVNIYRGDRCLFAGYIELQAYSQGYNEEQDELELSCIDALSALQYAKYRNVGALGVVYDIVKADASQRTMADIMREILAGVYGPLDLCGASGSKVWYDGSKAMKAADPRYGVFGSLSLSELLFLGDDEDGVWTQKEVLEAMLKYLDLHIVQQGLDFHIFSWETVRGDDPITWGELYAQADSENPEETTTDRVTVTLSPDNVSSDDTTISIGEVYSRLLLTCRTESVESVVESPLDSDALTSPYSNRQKYMTEYSADGEGERAYKAFYAMTHDEPTDYDAGAVTDWYLQVRDNPMWSFPEGGSGEDVVDKYCRDNRDQQRLPNLMPKTPTAAIISLGKVETKTDNKDNAPVSKVAMTDYMVVSVNGNGSDDAATTYPNESSLKGSSPCAVYAGSTSGGVYSPSDENATNYIVLSGSVVLNPVMAFTRDYKFLHETDRDGWTRGNVWRDTVPSRTNEDGRFYTQKYYKAPTPFGPETWDRETERGLVPFTDTGEQLYEFKYSAIGDGSDTVSKVAVLACMLIIGDKCVVETGTQGQPSDFEWHTYKSREECVDDDEYYAQCFTIGFDPKIGDKLIGTSFDLQNNIHYRLGIEAEGTAIPIKRDDHVSGAVRFMILGPVNTVWGDVTRRHGTWFRRTKWSVGQVPLLAHVSSIFLKSFEVKVYSDNGLINNLTDDDLVYMSDTRESFVNPKDDIEFRISSALTVDESRELGVSDSVKLSTPLDLLTGYGALTIYDRNREEEAKPERLYVDSYYNEYHLPRVIMTQKVDDSPEIASIFHHYCHPAMPDKTFYVQSLSRNLIEGYAELSLKER